MNDYTKKIIVLFIFAVTIFSSILLIDTAHNNNINIKSIPKLNYDLKGNTIYNNSTNIYSSYNINTSTITMIISNNSNVNPDTAITISETAFFGFVNYSNNFYILKNLINYTNSNGDTLYIIGTYTINIFNSSNVLLYKTTNINYFPTKNISLISIDIVLYSNLVSNLNGTTIQVVFNLTNDYVINPYLANAYQFPKYIIYNPTPYVFNFNYSVGNFSYVLLKSGDYEQESTGQIAHTNIIATILNFKLVSGEYILTFTNASNFIITYNNQKYIINSNNYIFPLGFNNGTYTFYLTNITNNVTTNVVVNVHGTDLIINLNSIIYNNITADFLVYFAFIILSLMFFSKYATRSIFLYSVSFVIFMFMGYKLNIEFFNQELFAILITLLAGLFAYKIINE